MGMLTPLDETTRNAFPEEGSAARAWIVVTANPIPITQYLATSLTRPASSPAAATISTLRKTLRQQDERAMTPPGTTRSASASSRLLSHRQSHFSNRPREGHTGGNRNWRERMISAMAVSLKCFRGTGMGKLGGMGGMGPVSLLSGRVGAAESADGAPGDMAGIRSGNMSGSKRQGVSRKPKSRRSRRIELGTVQNRIPIGSRSASSIQLGSGRRS